MTTEPDAEQGVAAADEPVDETPDAEEPAIVGPEAPNSDERPSGPPIEPAAAAELAQEITLVTRALFAQMLPATSRNAIAGLPGHHTPASSFGSTTTGSGATAGADTPATIPEPAPQQPPSPVSPEAPAATAAPAAPETVPTGSPQTPPGIAPPPLSVPGIAPGVTPGLAGPTPASETPAAAAASQPIPPAVNGLPVPRLGAPGAQSPATTPPPTDSPTTPAGTPAIPVPGLGTVPPAPAEHPDAADPQDDEPEQPATRPRQPTRRSLSVLDEVAFLDD